MTEPTDRAPAHRRRRGHLQPARRCSSGWSRGCAEVPRARPRSWSSTTPRPTARGSGSAAQRRRRACRAARWPTTAAAPAASTTGCAWAVERGADLVWLMDDDGLPDADCLATLLEHARRPRLLGAGRRRRGRPATGWSSRSGCPAAPASCTGWPTSTAAAVDGADPRRRDPVQRRAGHPRAGRADRPAPRGVLHLGRRPRVPPARRAGRRAGSPPSSTRGCATPASATSARR